MITGGATIKHINTTTGAIKVAYPVQVIGPISCRAAISANRTDIVIIGTTIDVNHVISAITIPIICPDSRGEIHMVFTGLTMVGENGALNIIQGVYACAAKVFGNIMGNGNIINTAIIGACNVDCVFASCTSIDGPILYAFLTATSEDIITCATDKAEF